jgi:DNA invertase Pin-like site-specific DNA recombinase
MREWARENGYRVEPSIRDHDEDSEATDRDGLRELYARVRPGVTVAVELWDRLGRGWPLGAINHEIERRGGRTVSITQGADPLVRELHGLLGAQYLDQLSDRLASVTHARVRRGLHVGATPYAYDRPGRLPYTDKHGIPKIRHSGPLEPVQALTGIVRRIFARWVAGDSLRRIALDLSADGVPAPEGGSGRVGNRDAGREQSGRRLAPAALDHEHDGTALVEVHPTRREPVVLEPGDVDELVPDAHPNGLNPSVSEVSHTSSLPQWTPQTVTWILKNPVYAGGVRCRGEIVWDAQHDPIIDRATWDAAQRRFDRAVPVRIKPEPHWCEGLVIHACGSRMLLNMVQRPGGGRYPSFRCSASAHVPNTCTHARQHIGAPLLDRAVRDCLARDLGTAVSVADAVARAVADAGGDGRAERDRLLIERAELERQRARSRAAYVASDEPPAVWAAEKARFDALFAGMDRRLAALPAEPDGNAIAQASTALRSLADALRDPAVDPAELRAWLTELGTAVVAERGVTIAYAGPYRWFVPCPAVVDPKR